MTLLLKYRTNVLGLKEVAQTRSFLRYGMIVTYDVLTVLIFVMHYSFSIQRYSVIPLSTNSGLIGWVPHCDTLHSLIRDYREKKKILLNIEHRIMLRV